MTTTTEYPLMKRICDISRYANEMTFEKEFPNLVFQGAGLARFTSCIGFLRGVAAAGKMDMAEKLAETFFNAFWIGMSDKRALDDNLFPFLSNIKEHARPHVSKLVVWDDGTFLGFGFTEVVLCSPDNKGLLSKELPGGPSQYTTKYSYVGCMSGGILFHGLDQVFSVNIDGGIGWSMHT